MSRRKVASLSALKQPGASHPVTFRMIIDTADVFLDKERSGRLEFPGKERVTVAPILQSARMNASQFSGKLIR